MRARKEKVIATLTGGLKQIAGKRNVKVVQAKAAFEDGRTLRLQAVGNAPLADDRIRFENCILASGSRPSRIPAFNLPHAAGDGLHRARWNCRTCPSRCWWSAAATSAWRWARSTRPWARA